MPRGSDFTARWTEGAWAELKILEALNVSPDLIAVQYGITTGEAFRSAREMDARALPDQKSFGKRPDVLVFHRQTLTTEELAALRSLHDFADSDCEAIVRKAALAIESEFSPYDYNRRLEQYGKELSFTIKEEDLLPTKRWHEHFGIEVGIVQIFLDRAYILTLNNLLNGIADGSIKRKFENYYKKHVYYPPMSRGVVFGAFTESPAIVGEITLDKYGKYTVHRKVTGGRLEISDDTKELVGHHHLGR